MEVHGAREREIAAAAGLEPRRVRDQRSRRDLDRCRHRDDWLQALSKAPKCFIILVISP